ncbi:hypothetical protein ACFU8Q_37950 [Streptomyces sp. NPDC057543]|uniref:hypothetical protein n=1 Tax=Streptomyces sp. NPDC057543 TaxID=3346163 RepID=UPI0036D0AA84
MKIPRLLDDRLKLRHLVLVDALSRVRCAGATISSARSSKIRESFAASAPSRP